MRVCAALADHRADRTRMTAQDCACHCIRLARNVPGEPSPGIGPIIASAVATSVPDASVFKTGRQFAAWLGLVPKQSSTGGKDHLGGITKAGDRYIRRLWSSARPVSSATARFTTI